MRLSKRVGTYSGSVQENVWIYPTRTANESTYTGGHVRMCACAQSACLMRVHTYRIRAWMASCEHTKRIHVDECASRFPTHKTHACTHAQKSMTNESLYARPTQNTCTCAHKRVCTYTHAARAARMYTRKRAGTSQHQHECPRICTGSCTHGNVPPYACNTCYAYSSASKGVGRRMGWRGYFSCLAWLAGWWRVCQCQRYQVVRAERQQDEPTRSLPLHNFDWSSQMNYLRLKNDCFKSVLPDTSMRKEWSRLSYDDVWRTSQNKQLQYCSYIHFKERTGLLR